MGIRMVGGECSNCHRTCSVNEGETVCDECKTSEKLVFDISAPEIEFGVFDLLRLKNHEEVDIEVIASTRKGVVMSTEVRLPRKQEGALRTIIGNRAKLTKKMSLFKRVPFSGSFFMSGLCTPPRVNITGFEPTRYYSTSTAYCDTRHFSTNV